MQTKVWGPALWIGLHCIAQNYPWKPTDSQQKYYLNFFTLIGDVLPCRYCRESYQRFIKEPDTLLNESVVKNRKTMVTWLYDIHNKVNKKLDITTKPSLKEVWNRYESYRSKCTKSPEIINKLEKKGCLDPMNGVRKKCIIKIINNNSFGKKKQKIKLISIKKANSNSKKLTAIFEINGKTKKIHFGAKGMSDFTKHKDISRRNRYIKRHLKDLNTKNPIRAGYLSMFILWNKKSLKASIQDYKKRLTIYNNTSRFPTKIS